MPLSTLSLYETARSSRPMLVTVPRIQASSVTSGHVGLAEEGRLRPGPGRGPGNPGRRRRSALARGFGGVLGGRQGVVVGDEVEALTLVLQGDVLLDGAEVVAQMQLAGRLHAAEDAERSLGPGPWPWPAAGCSWSMTANRPII